MHTYYIAVGKNAITNKLVQKLVIENSRCFTVLDTPLPCIIVAERSGNSSLSDAWLRYYYAVIGEYADLGVDVEGNAFERLGTAVSCYEEGNTTFILFSREDIYGELLIDTFFEFLNTLREYTLQGVLV